jgi:hypothetical protein
MRKERLAAAGQPALVVTYGNTTRKHRPLDREVTILGRAPAATSPWCRRRWRRSTA